MSYIIIENFNGGLDTRRLASAGTPGTLMELVNAHITRGGEIEKRRAFVEEHVLPAGTVGLANTTNDLYVFGSDPDPGVPSGVTYQRLQHPTNPGGESLTRILSWDTYADKLYVAAEFSDGSVHHFYDGVYVENWWDGKARGAFTVVESGNASGAGSRSDFFRCEKGGETLQVEVFLVKEQPEEGDEPVSLTGGSFTVLGTQGNAGYASDIRDAINNHTSDPNFLAGVGQPPGSIHIGEYVEIFCDDTLLDLNDYQLLFHVEDTSNTDFIAKPNAAERWLSCFSTGGCTNNFQLVGDQDNGTAPYTYAWEVVDDGGAGAAVFKDTQTSTSTLQNPVLQVTAGTTAGGRNLGVTVKLEVTDNGANTTERRFTVVSNHWSARTFDTREPGSLA